MENLRGIVMMVVSMAAFAIEDMFVKLSAERVPTGEILLLMGIFGGALFWALARREGRAIVTAEVLVPPIFWRNVGEMVGTLGFVTAIVMTPISSASAIAQATPLAVTCGAALFLGERVGWRRWLAIAVGFLGVLVVIRPGLEGFQLASLWGVVAVLGMAFRDIATRQIPATTSTMQVGAWGFLTIAVLGAGMLALAGGAVMPTPTEALMLFCAMGFGFGGYWALILATRVGEVSAIVPFRYSRLLFALGVGIFVFGERPDAWTLAGAGLIMGSGLYGFMREQRLRRLSMRSAAR